MNLEQLVTSKEISQQLADAGVKHEALFYWTPKYITTVMKKDYELTQPVRTGLKLTIPSDWIPAYTSTELMELIPSTYFTLRLNPNKETRYDISFENRFRMKNRVFFLDSSLPDALGRMALYLSKEGLLK